MEKSRKIVIITLCVITFITGVVYASAKVDPPRAPISGTKHVERILMFPDEGIFEGIEEVINLEGYKDLQISWAFKIQPDAEDGYVELYWCSSEGYQVGGSELRLTDDLYPTGNWGTESTEVKSNYLTIRIKNDTTKAGDFITLILYATK